MTTTTIISWNINGIRSNRLTVPGHKYSARRANGELLPFHTHPASNFAQMVEKHKPDIVCLQETRCDLAVANSITDDCFPFRYFQQSTRQEQGRTSGYAGTAIWARIKPINVTMGLPTLTTPNREGRIITLEFDSFFVITVYTPNSGTNEAYRIGEWDPAIKQYLTDLILTGKNIIFAGDMNVCHHELDIFSGFPSNSIRIAGLLPEERSAFNQYIDIGLRDPYRELYPDEDEAFTWWNPRIKKFREANKGWRIDYTLVSKNVKVHDAQILTNVFGSDHCPILLKIQT